MIFAYNGVNKGKGGGFRRRGNSGGGMDHVAGDFIWETLAGFGGAVLRRG